MNSDTASCPLCDAGQPTRKAVIGERCYYECETCRMIFLDPAQRLSPAAERVHYDTHENDPGNQRYRDFLDRLAAPLVTCLPPGAHGLDYGAGPGPTLSVMLNERGFPTEIYDPFFAPDTGVLERTYDFITCSETAEHFYHPAQEFERFNQLLRPGGWLGVMTQWHDPQPSFAAWHYLRDPTHVSLYSRQTLRWIARRYNWTLHMPGRDIALFRKPGQPIK